MKKLLIILAIVCTTTLMQASSITGTVKDSTTNQSIAGAKISLVGTNQTTYTNFNGQFIFDNISEGNYHLKISFISFKTHQSPKLLINNNELHHVKINLTPIEQ